MTVGARAAELLQRIEQARAPLDRRTGALPDDTLAASPARGWAVKDHLAHIAAWERLLVAHLTDGTDHALVGMTRAEFETAPLDELNERIHRLHRDAPAPQVRAESAAAHHALLGILPALSDEVLASPYWEGWADSPSVFDKVAGDTYKHYAEHLSWIEQALAAWSAST